MSDAPKKHAVEAATLVLIEMLRSQNVVFTKGSAEKSAAAVIATHQSLVEYFQQYPDHDASLVLSRHKALSS